MIREPFDADRNQARELAPSGGAPKESKLLTTLMMTVLPVGAFTLSVVALPLVGIWLSRGLADDAVRYLKAWSPEAAQLTCAHLSTPLPGWVVADCDLLSSARLIEHAWIANVALLLSVLASFWVANRALAHSRERISRLYPVTIHACVAGVVFTLLSQGALLLWLGWEEGLAARGVLFCSVFGAGLIMTSLTIIWSWRGLLRDVALPVSGIVVEPGPSAELWRRIEHVATLLQTSPPKRLIVGLEPTAFVTSAALDLQGTGLLPATETLYLPLSAIRLWSDQELDAVIGHELAHLRAADTLGSGPLLRAIRSFMLSLESLEPEQNPWACFLGSGMVPALCILWGMLWLLTGAVRGNDRQRELAADQGAVSVSSATALLGAIAKLTFIEMEWLRFTGALEKFLSSGRTRVNLVQDLVARMNLLRRAADPSKLIAIVLASEQPHPFDSHPPFAERATAFSLDAASILKRSLADIDDFRVPSKEMRRLEESLTTALIERMHKCSSELEVDLDPSTPGELAWPY
jgi:Zn-dependent protease with chaperone function